MIRSTSLSLQREKLGAIEKFAGNEHTERGQRFEPEVFARYRELMGAVAGNHTFRAHPIESDWVGGSPDGLILRPRGVAPRGLGLLEIKTLSEGKSLPGRPQDYYMPQVGEQADGVGCLCCYPAVRTHCHQSPKSSSPETLHVIHAGSGSHGDL